MGTETLPDSATVASGLLIQSSDFLTVIASLQGAVVGRNTSGVPTSGQSLGTALYPWGNLYTNALTVDGKTIDVSEISVPPTRIISGRTTTASGQPSFLQANGAAASVKILATTTDLVLSINSTTITISADITEGSLSTAPSSNNTCLINDTNFTDQADSKYFGEIDGRIPYITIDTVGSEISALVGQWISLKTDTNEIMFGWLKSATELTSVYRGFYFDSSLAPIVRETLVNNEVLTLLKTGWIFVDDDGATVDVTYTTPVYTYTAPTSPVADDYWYDMTNTTWKRYSGSAWVAVDRIPLGLCVQNTSNCIGARSFDFFGGFRELNTLGCEVFSDTVVRSGLQTSNVDVYGTHLTFENYPVEWDNLTDMETGSVGNDTEYYLYLSTGGDPKISLERPYDRITDLRGKYHPYENWRYICKAKTDGSADWISVIASSMFDRESSNAKWQADNLVNARASVITVSCSYDRLVLTNPEGKTKILYDGSHTFDITEHAQGSELASHWYQLYIDGSGKLALVPDITGSCDGTSAGYLVDSTNSFSDYSVFKGATIYNLTDSTKTKVSISATSNGANLAVDDDIMVSGDDYCIHLTDPVGLDSFACNIGAVYNDSGSDFDDFHQVDNTVVFDDTRVLVTGTATTPTAVPLGDWIPSTAKKVIGYAQPYVLSGGDCRVSITPTSDAALGRTIVGLSTNVATNDPAVYGAFEMLLLETQTIYYDKTQGYAVHLQLSSYTI